ncbi:GTPase-activating protein pac-1 [Frankliniella fusca]|uniref:GTPase-activating protein pac-1 n=1 Tax=Frankliniella fusca TaxID=407009 RepID=A0AAE1L9M5_9NEOP|nr:GTPase-activating protein pac-1 [Frankliniella fusca]
MSKLDDLLHRLAVIFPNMPLTYSTLFRCDYQFDISEFISGGKFWYKGIKSHLQQLDLTAYLEKYNCITLDIGMGGLPLTNVKLWPILGSLVGSENDPFIIAVYRGKEDPKDVNEFLSQYKAEVTDLLLNGFEFHGTKYGVVIRIYILDAPARQFIKCITSHCGYAGCERCTVYGEFIDFRLIYLQTDAPLRTDESFKDRAQPKHHKGTSPLEELGTDMISRVVLDPMHMVYAGVVKRLIDFWLHQVGPWKLHIEVVQLISSIFDFLRPYCPFHFNRKPRSLKYFKTFKCAELRRILLYNGILAFKDLVDENVYKHFLLLHCGIYILCSKSLFSTKNAVAEQLIRLFVTHASHIYGELFVVYNVHSIVHLPSECYRLDMPLDEFSSFKYENKLKSIKECLKSGLHQLQQLARRDQEKKSNVVKLPRVVTHVYLSLRNRLAHGRVGGLHFKKLRAGGFTLRVGQRNSFFLTKSRKVAVLRDIVKRHNKVYLICRRFHTLEDFYVYPIPSSDLDIFRVSDLGGEKLTFRLSDVLRKCYLMPDGDQHFLCVPLLHALGCP